jgi:hypothetical protein
VPLLFEVVEQVLVEDLTMQKYILGASPTKQTAMIRPFDDTGVTGDWREFNAGIVSLERDVDSEMILKDAIIAELKQSIATLNRSNMRLRQKIDRLSS